MDIQVKGCKNCPFYGHEDDQTYCTLNNDLFEVGLEDTLTVTDEEDSVPNNCPLHENDINVIL